MHHSLKKIIDLECQGHCVIVTNQVWKQGSKHGGIGGVSYIILTKRFTDISSDV
jgi:hypothetical protein